MQNDLSGMTEKYKSLIEKNRTLIKSFQEKSMDQETQLSKIHEQNKTIQEENKTLVDDHTKKIKELNNLIIDLKTDNKALTEEKNILLDSHDGATHDLANRVNDLRKEIETHQIDLRQSNQQVTDLEEQLNEVTQKYNELNQKIETLKAELDDKNTNHNVTLKDLNQEIEKLQTDLEKEREQVNTVIKDRHNDLLKKNDQIRGLEAKIDELENILQYEKQLKSTSIIVDDPQLKLESQELKTNSLELKIHIEQAPQNKPSEYKVDPLVQIQDKQRDSVVFDTPGSIHPTMRSEFGSEIKLTKDNTDSPKIGTINSNTLSPFRDNSANTSKMEYTDSKSSITNNRKLNRFRVLRSLNNLEENKGRNIQHVVNLEKELETLNEQRKELEDERKTLKAQLTTSFIEIEELKKDKEEYPMPEIKTFLKKAQSAMLPDDEASSPTLRPDPQTKIEKLKKDVKRLREERQNLREENSELRASIKLFQEQIVKGNQAAGSSKKENNEIISTIYESLVQLFNMETLRGKVEVKLATKEEAKETMGYVKQAFEENEEDIMALVKELDEYDKYREESEAVKGKVSAVEKEWQEKVTEINERLKEERKRCRDDINFVEHDMYQRFVKISQAIGSFIKENAIAEVHTYRDTYPVTDGFVSLENVIYANLNILREYIEACVQVQDNYER